MNLNDVFENALLSRWADLLPSRAPGRIGSIHEADCELVDLGGGRTLALTVDAVDEEIAAGLYLDAETAARMAVIATLSDLAAVGAFPLGLLLSVCLPARARASTQVSVARGIRSACERAGVHVLGGDTSEGDSLRIACIGAGIVDGPVLRRVGLRPGDRLFASGPLGTGAAVAAAELLGVSGIGIDARRFAPPPRLAYGRALRGVASACIDTSDGLIAAIDQLARLNENAIDLDADLDALLSPVARAARERTGVRATSLLAAPHGEYELVFGVPPDRIAELAVEALPIGVVKEGAGASIGGRSFDGARVRNLFAEVDGDLARWVAGIESLWV